MCFMFSVISQESNLTVDTLTNNSQTHLTNNCSWLLTRHDTTVAPVNIERNSIIFLGDYVQIEKS